MRHLDTEFAQECITRIRKIPDDAKPVEHLLFTMKNTLKPGRIPDASTWFSRNVLRWLLLWGIAPIPKNVQLPAQYRKRGITFREPGDLEDLEAALEKYLQLVQTGDFAPPNHPILGKIGIDGWSVFHVRHINHHLKQFGV